MDNQYIENISASLVREYLARKGLKNTLKVMDDELPRTESSISNRVALAKEVKIEKMMRLNKEKDVPYRTMIEVITKHMIDSAGGEPVNPSPVVVHNNALGSKKPTSADSSHGSSDDRSSPPLSRTRNGKKPVSSGLKKNSGDLVLEDAGESETILGDGTDNLITAQPEPVITANVHTATITPRPRSSRRGLGMAGAISSNLDDREKRMKRPVHKPMNYPQQNIYKMDVTDNKKTDDFNLSVGTENRLPLKTDTRNEGLTKRSEKPSREPIVDILAADPSPRPLGVVHGRRLEKSVTPDQEEQSILSVRGERLKYGRRSSLEGEKLVEKYDVNTSSICERPPTRGEKRVKEEQVRPKPAATSTRVGDVEIGDIDDLDNDLADLEVSRPVPTHSNVTAIDAKPIDLQTAMDLKILIFGSPSGTFNEEWRDQSFTFSDLPELQYGIVQKKGGPCGVLASVQACFLQELLFTDGKNNGYKSLTLERRKRSETLAKALSNILWRAGENRQAIVTLPGGRTMFSSGMRYKADGLTETLTLNKFEKKNDLTHFMMKCVSQFELDGNSGVVLALYSAILSRSIKSLKHDMDDPGSKFMGAHSYCTQEMVNLLLTGKAVSNVFNGIIELGEMGQSTTLRGISTRCDIGLLSLFEHYKSCQVGTFMKTPVYPIWVVCSESHFSVLFSVKKELVCDWKAERQFDLYYYDGLMRQDEEIKLSIDTTNRFYEPASDEDLVPPLEHCIRTKWPEAAIDWNGTEPIL